MKTYKTRRSGMRPPPHPSIYEGELRKHALKIHKHLDKKDGIIESPNEDFTENEKYRITYNQKLKPEKGVELSKGHKSHDLKIHPFKVDKDGIHIREHQENQITPKHPGSAYFVGSSSSGKTTMMANLLCAKQYFGKRKGQYYFDKIYVFSPTASVMDQMYKYMIAHGGLEKKYIYNDFDISKLRKILNDQKKEIEQKEADGAPRVLIILDDCVADEKFMKSQILRELLFQQRHYGISTWVCSQYFMGLPRNLRLNCFHYYVFGASNSERKRLNDEFDLPREYEKGTFDKMFNYATSDRYNFMTIAKNLPIGEGRYRKNLDERLIPTKIMPK